VGVPRRAREYLVDYERSEIIYLVTCGGAGAVTVRL
jgi:hypothetical protein